MHTSKLLIPLTTTCLLLLLAAGSGCATRTKFGDLIPAHELSDQREGEEVWLDIKLETPKRLTRDVDDEYSSKQSESVRSFPGITGQVAGVALGALIDYAKAQMQTEAARYDADFYNVAFSTTDVLFTNNNHPLVLLTRWVKHTPPATPEYTNAIDKVFDIVKNAAASSHHLAERKTLNSKSLPDQLAGKSLAFAYCIELEPSSSTKTRSWPFLIKPRWKWQWLAKSKIVGTEGSYWLSKPAGFFLKTGSEVEYEVSFILSALVNTTNGYPQTITIGLKDPIQANTKFDLNAAKHFEDYTDDTVGQKGGWVLIPGYPDLTGPGFCGIGISVKESDPSNVKTMLLKGSKYLDNNKQTLINSVVGGQ